MRVHDHLTVDTPLSVLGIGAMPMSQGGFDLDAPAPVWHHAFNQGLNLINTADCYCPSDDQWGYNEQQVGRAVASYGRAEVFVVTKNGLVARGDHWERDNSREYLLGAAERSCARLGFEPDALLLHRRNREQPLVEAIEALLEIKTQGLTRHIGLSNVHLDELDEAWLASDGQIAFVENERSPRYREDADVLARCNELGIAYLAWSPLGGHNAAGQLAELHPAFAEVAAARGVSAQQIALAWLLAQGPAMTPIPAFRRIETADDSIAATLLTLEHAEIDFLNASPVGPGSVYPD